MQTGDFVTFEVSETHSRSHFVSEVSGGIRARVSGRIPDYQMVSATLLLSERKTRPKIKNPNRWVDNKFSFL